MAVPPFAPRPGPSPLSSNREQRWTDAAAAVPTPRPGAVDPSVGRAAGGWDGLRVLAGRPSPGLAVVRVVGEIDLLSAPRWHGVLCRALVDAVGPEHPGPREAGPRLVCDLSGVDFFGAAGLRVLVDVGGRSAAAGGELRLVIATRAVRRALELSGLERAWPVHDQLLGAVTAPDRLRGSIR